MDLPGYMPIARQSAQRGVFAIMLAVLLPFILAMIAFGLGLAQLYNRKVELQSMANFVALAAARQLDGTEDGLKKAIEEAELTAKRFTFAYGHPISWHAGALSFSDSPDGPWSASAAGTAAKLFYARVDTAALDEAIGLVRPVFIEYLKVAKTFKIDGRAIAGRTSVKALPMAVCAFSHQAASERGQELVEYGFRRGVVYDLMNMNPLGDKPEHFTIDPAVLAGAAVTPYNTAAATVGPFVCTGKMWVPRIIGADVRVTRGFSISSLYKQLNSRFDQYDGQLCNINGAPPDINIRALTGGWMSPAQDEPYTAPYSTATQLQTVADPLALPPGTTNKHWGALWASAKAVRFSSYQAGKPEPANGYTTFATADMATLYGSAVSTSAYPNSNATPYTAMVSFPANRKLAVERRRVLRVPLLACPVPAGADVTATVLAVGKFFMISPATSEGIVAEFAGIASEQSVTGPVELFP